MARITFERAARAARSSSAARSATVRAAATRGAQLLACAALALAGCRSTTPAPDVARGDVHRTAPAAPAAEVPEAPAGRVVELEGLRVRVDEGVVEIEARTCLDRGWLEQVACSPGTREHESLVVVPSRPSDVHAALLLAGFEPGRPGAWTYEDGRYAFEPPRGERLQVLVRVGDAEPVPIARWIEDERTGEGFADEPWIFGGSMVKQNPAWMGPGEHYVADMAGSVIGLVTFGDEVIGFSRVIADEASVAAPVWVVDADAVPPIDTDVHLIVRRWPG